MSEDDPQPVNPYEPPVAIAQQSAAGGRLRRRWVQLQPGEQQLAQVVYRPADRGGVSLVWTDQRVVARTRGLVGFARLAVPVTRVSKVEVRRAPSAAAWILSAGLVFLAVWVVVLGALGGEFGLQLFAALALISTPSPSCPRLSAATSFESTTQTASLDGVTGCFWASIARRSSRG